MTITFPRTRPEALHVATMQFLLQPMTEISATRGGKQLGLDIGPSLWYGEWESPPMEEEDFGEARAFFDTLASAEAFYAYDNLREYPVTYKTAGWSGLLVGPSAFDGICYMTDVRENGLEIVLSSLPVGFILKPGDYLSFDYGATDQYRALHRVSAMGVADGGGDMALEVRPYIRAGWEGGESPGHRAVTLYRPSAKMIVVPGSYSESIPVHRFGTVSFKAVQTLGA